MITYMQLLNQLLRSPCTASYGTINTAILFETSTLLETIKKNSTITNEETIKQCLHREGVTMIVACQDKSPVCGSYSLCQAEVSPIKIHKLSKGPNAKYSMTALLNLHQEFSAIPIFCFRPVPVSLNSIYSYVRCFYYPLRLLILSAMHIYYTNYL